MKTALVVLVTSLMHIFHITQFIKKYKFVYIHTNDSIPQSIRLIFMPDLVISITTNPTVKDIHVIETDTFQTEFFSAIIMLRIVFIIISISNLVILFNYC